MQTLENDSAAVACVVTDSSVPKASYEAVRFNAKKYDILPRLGRYWPMKIVASLTIFWPR